MKNFSESPWGKEYERFETDPAYAREKTLREISALVGRVIGEKWAEYFSFQLNEATEGEKDCFTICEKDGRICIEGKNGVSLAAGFNYYLKNYAFVNYNPIFGSQRKMQHKLPSVPEKNHPENTISGALRTEFLYLRLYDGLLGLEAI